MVAGNRLARSGRAPVGGAGAGRWGGRVLLPIGCLLVWLGGGEPGVGPSPAWALQARVASSTSLLVDELQAWDGSLLPRRELAHELRLGLYDLAGTDRLQLQIVGRLLIAGELGLQEGETLEADAARTLDVPYLSFEARELLGGHLDLRLGRQLELLGSEFLLFDGAHVLLRGPLHLAVEGVAGWPVRRLVSPVGLELFEPDGVPLATTSTLLLGGGVLLQGFEPLRVRVVALQEGEQGTLSRQVLGGGLDFTPRSGIALDLQAVYDLVWRRQEQLQAGLRLEGPAGLTWTARFDEQRPRFDLGSIFAVFPVEPRRSFSLRTELVAGPWLFGLTGSRLSYLPAEEVPGAAGTVVELAAPAALPGSEGGGQLEVALRLRPDLHLQAAGGLRAGYGGSRRSARVGGSWLPRSLPDGRVELLARWMRLADDLSPWHAGDTFALDLSGSFVLWRRVRVSGVLEQAATPARPWWLRALALVDLEYWR
ncbi:MAG: hypothetical protein RBU45_26365 [Myxococcota bacterium]|jgi:hypothetical protein|nr:hypothetical protein [Myxococcota bacterium]